MGVHMPQVGRTNILDVRVYDPTFYTAYAFSSPPQLTGTTDCTLSVITPDTSAAAQDFEKWSAAILEDQTGDVLLDFVDRVRLTCGSD